MRITFLFILLSFLFSQDYNRGNKSFKAGSFKGEIIDSSDNSPIQYATIKLIKSSDETLIDGTISEEDGYFVLKDVNPGKYNIQIEHVMYEKLILKDQLLVPPNLSKNLGVLTLVQKVVEIGDVNVVEEKPFIQEEIDKKVYNVEDMAIATSGTAEDVLNNLPSVSVDTEGNISLRGNESVNIMVDGRMKSSTNLDILDAAMIEKIEVITIPSAKYDPDGTAGIINIITKRNEYSGTSGKVTPGFDSYGSKTFSINTNYLKNKFNLFASYTNGKRISEGYSNRDFKRLDDSTSIDIVDGYNRHSNFDNERNNQNFKLGMEFYPDNNRTFFCDFNYSDYVKSGFETMYNIGIDEDVYLPQTITNINNKHDGYERGLMAGYSIKLDDEGQEISIETDSEFDKHSTSQTIGTINTSDSEEHNGYAFKIDYVHPFHSDVPDKTNLLEFGILDKQHGHRTLFDYDNFATYDFNYARNILATYLDLTYYINPEFGFKFGTRFEKSSRIFNANSTELASDDSNFYLFMINQNLENDSFSKSYNTIYPSLFFNYNLKEKGNIKFGFGRRVERPGDWALAPVPHDFAEENQMRIGNPVINPEDILKYEVSYSNRLRIGFLTSSLFFMSIKDAFDWDQDKYQYGYCDGGAEEYCGDDDITPEDESLDDTWINDFIQNPNCFEDCYNVLSYDNLAETTEFGVEFFLMTRPYNWWDLKFGGDISFSNLSSKPDAEGNIESDQNGKITSTSFFTSSTFTIKEHLKLDMNTWMWMTELTNGKIHPMHSTSLALKYDFLNKFSFVFKIDDLFDSRKFSIETAEPWIDNDEISGLVINSGQDIMDYGRQRNGRNLVMSFEYRFGDYKENKFKRGSHGHGHDGGDMMGY